MSNERGNQILVTQRGIIETGLFIFGLVLTQELAWLDVQKLKKPL